MKKKWAVFLTVVLLIMGLSSSFVDAGGSSMRHSGSAVSETLSVSEPVETVIAEEVTILDQSGTCDVYFLMTVHASPLAEVFRNMFNFTESTSESEDDIPESVLFEHDLQVEENITYTPMNVTPAPTSIREPFLNGIIEEHFYSLGITITLDSITRSTTWGDESNCVVAINATGALQVVEPGRALVGPLDVNASFNRIGFIFNKIGMIQQMLNSFDGEQEYVSTWTTTFHGGNASNVNLTGTTWYQDFGNGNLLDANLAATAQQVTLSETMRVTEQSIAADPEELLEDGFLVYKTFDILYDPFLGQTALNPQSAYDEGEGLMTFDGTLDPSWSMNLLDEIYEWNPISKVTLTIHPRLTFTGHLSWDWKWNGKLQKFKAWTKLTAEIDVDLAVDASYKKEWSKDILTRKKYHAFMVGVVPVEVTIQFKVTAYLEFSADFPQFSYIVTATGWMKAGIKWARGKGWKPIRDADMNLDIGTPPSLPTEGVVVTITPSVGFRLTLLLYETAGPFIEFKPYAALTLRPDADPPTRWTFELGIDVNAGIEFGKWLKNLLDLDDYSWPIVNFVLWRCNEGNAPKHHDLAMSDVRAPDTAFVNEPVSVSADVMNIGNNDEDIAVALYYRQSSPGEWTKIDEWFDYLPTGTLRTVWLDWDTSSLPDTATSYEILVQTWITLGDPDEDSDNNYLIDGIDLEIQDIRIANAVVMNDPPVVFAVQDVEIKVTVVNDGSATILDDAINAYYDNEYIGTKMVSGLTAGSYVILKFKWDTWGVGLGYYAIKAEAAHLDYEIDYTNNAKIAEDEVLVIDMIGGYNVDVAVTDVDVAYAQPSLSEQVVFKGDLVDINVTVVNQGPYNETFDLTAYATSLSDVTFRIQTEVVTLLSGDSTVTTFVWNTAGKEILDTYTVYAYAWPSPYEDETNRTDNTHTADGTVTIANSQPMLDPIGDQTVDELVTLQFTANATDRDLPLQTLAFELGPSAPSGASITSDGVFSWTPTEVQGPDVFNVNITVSDGLDAAYEFITITVVEVNQPPALEAIGNKTVSVLGVPLEFIVNASDPDIPGQTLSYSASNLPPNATFDNETRVFRWIVLDLTHNGTVHNVTFSVSDGDQNDNETIVITVDIPVGGVWIPVDKLGLLTPYIVLAVALVAVTVGALYTRKR